MIGRLVCDDCGCQMDVCDEQEYCANGACRSPRIRHAGPVLTSLPVGDAPFDREPVKHGLSVTEDRVLIRADREDHAPTQTDTGLYLASSLAAAVEGEDPGDSWFVGTIVQLGPLVNRLDVRSRVVRWLHELEDHEHDIALAEIRVLRQRIEDSPRDMPDPLQVGNRVAFSWAAGQQITVDGDRMLILRASDVLAVLEE